MLFDSFYCDWLFGEREDVKKNRKKVEHFTTLNVIVPVKVNAPSLIIGNFFYFVNSFFRIRNETFSTILTCLLIVYLVGLVVVTKTYYISLIRILTHVYCYLISYAPYHNHISSYTTNTHGHSHMSIIRTKQPYYIYRIILVSCILYVII